MSSLPSWVVGGLAASVVVGLAGSAGWLRSAPRGVPARSDLTATSALTSAATPPSRVDVPVRRGLVGVVVVLVVLAASVLGPEPVVVVMAVVGLARVRAARSAAAARRRAVERAVPDLVDLFVIAAAAGHTVPGCLTMVGPRAPLPVRPVLTRAGTALARGRTLADVLDDLGPQLGVLGPTLTGVLASSAATGAPLGAALADVAALARDRRRREAENEVRRLPVTMLFPLVCCVLPAFVLLAVVPLLAAALASLEV